MVIKKKSAGQGDSEKMENNKKFLEYEREVPIQLSLFRLLDQKKEANYSQTVELYDFMPKYVWGKMARVNDLFLRTVERVFVCRDKRYRLRMQPARIQNKAGVEKEFYLSKKEELVEDALRKMAIFGDAYYLDNKMGFCFNINQLMNELKKSGHTYSRTQIIHSLQVLALTRFTLTSEDAGDNETYIFSPIETFGLKGVDDETHTFVRFSSLVTKSIDENTFRLSDYKVLMSYKNVIARQLHKRMGHHFVQANYAEFYEISLTTILRDFGLSPQKSLTSNLDDVMIALEEMYTKNSIMQFSADEKTYDVKRRNMLTNVKFKLHPSESFLNNVRIGNEKSRKREKILGGED